jgi:hypothetical protein
VTPFENRALRRIFGLKGDEVTGDWRKLHNIWGREDYTGFRWGNLRERGHWGDAGVDGRIILRWIFRK